MDPLDRRSFVALTASAAVAACLPCVPGCQSNQPKPPPGPYDIGSVLDYSEDGVTTKFAGDGGFFVVRRNRRVVACSDTCTHNGCTVKKSSDLLKCPCHGSQFETNGTLVHGPALTSLPRYAIRVENGRIIVDTSQRFDEDHWSDPAAIVMLTN